MAVGIFLLLQSWKHWRLLRRCLQDRPLDIAVDLSRPGKYESSFHLKYTCGFGYDLLLMLPSSAGVARGGDALFAGLDASCSIVDVHGTERLPVARMGKISPEIVGDMPARPIHLHSIRIPFPEGRYTFRLTVSQGTPRLSGIEQRLVMKYLVGAEGAVPFIFLGVGVSATAVAGILLWWIHRRSQIWGHL